MEEKIKKLREYFLKEVKNIQDKKAWEQFRITFLGRKSELATIAKFLKDVAPEDRPKIGAMLNTLKKEFETTLASLAGNLGFSTEAGMEKIDLTVPGRKQNIGHLHPVTQMMHQIWRIFQDLNFQVIQGPEIETDYYNFEALNIPQEHPARDMQDTFFVPGGLVLRTQTTSVDIRHAQKNKPPLRTIATGKTYRRDSDMTHTPMFHQFDGAVIDRDINMTHLKGTLHAVMERLLEAKLDVRFRISYFPFVEPGAEFDVSCTLCDQKGCATCKGTGWLEMGGCGMLHPKVIKNMGYDPQEYQGFAFGFGIERPFMIKHRIPDLRAFFENDIRFLEQF